MSRFSSLFDALSDKKARFLAEKQIVNDLIFDFYFNRLEGKNNFDAVVISGGLSGDSRQVVETGEGNLIAIKVRPLDIQDLALPDPCSKACQEAGESYISYLYALHPTAYSSPNTDGEVNIAPGFGSIVECYFEDRKNFRQLRWRPKGPDAQANYDFKCDEGLSKILNFTGPSLLGDIKTNQLEGIYVGRVEEFKEQTIKNGEVPSELLQRTKNAANNKLLLIDAADDFDKLATAFDSRFKQKLQLKSGYRSFEDQINIKRLKIEEDKSAQAATPGESRHGWGMAIDISTEYNGVRGFKSEIYKWMRRNASDYGWSYHNR